MAIAPTAFSRVSIGYVTSTKSLVDVDPADTGPVASYGGPVVFGPAGSQLNTISSVTRAVSLGAINPLDSSSVVTAAFSGVSRGDTLLLTVDSLYPVVAANRDIHWMCSSSSTVGEVHIWGVNSTLTAVTPTASTVVRLTRISHPTYL